MRGILPLSECYDRNSRCAARRAFEPWVKRNRELGGTIGDRPELAGFEGDLPTTLQVARCTYKQAKIKSAQLWIRVNYTVNADKRRLEILVS
jgi:hypothetical protein